jgi:hypothetical protein
MCGFELRELQYSSYRFAIKLASLFYTTFFVVYSSLSVSIQVCLSEIVEFQQ